MNRLMVLVVLPSFLFALERVNLIKDSGFEKDSEAWQTYVGLLGNGELDSVIANRHDSEKFRSGSWSASCDTRRLPGLSTNQDSAIVIQGFAIQKAVSDIDSIEFSYSLAPYSFYEQLGACLIALYLNAGKTPYWVAEYYLTVEGRTVTPLSPWVLLEVIFFQEDTSWHILKKGIYNDLNLRGIPDDATVDSLLLLGYGANIPPWWGQKVYFDDIRLTGYADYDVGVKEILSGDSLDEDTPYTPVARIKNFGRQDASDFSVIAEIFEGETRLYYDSLPWSLTSDTEDTVTFAAFTPSGAANHTLVVRTSISPDESDEDDEMTKTLFGTGIKEQPIPSGFVFEVSSFTTSPRVSYSLPADEHGTITLYDPTGRRIESLHVLGSGEVRFKAGLTSGVYFVKLESDNTSITRKAVVLR